MRASPHISRTFVARAWRHLTARCFDQGGVRDLAHRPQGGRTDRSEAPQGPAWALACWRHVASGLPGRNVALAGVYTVAAGGV